LRQVEMRARQHLEEILDHAGRIVAIDQRRAERAERVGPGAQDRRAEGRRRPLDGERHQKAQPRAGVVAVADDGEPDLAVVEARHRRRQEARVEEQVRLDGARAEIFELVDDVEPGRGRIDGERAPGLPVIPAGALVAPIGHEGGDAALLFEKRDSAHGKTSFLFLPPSGTIMTMPSRLRTATASSSVSKASDRAEATAAPHRPQRGIRTRFSPTLTASVAANTPAQSFW